MKIDQIARAAVERLRDRLVHEISEAGGPAATTEGDDRLRLSGARQRILEAPALRLVIGGAR